MPKDDYDRAAENFRGLLIEETLAQASDHQLLMELERRGYRGKLVKEPVQGK